MANEIRRSIAVLIMTFGAGGLQADVLNLHDGTRLVGTIEAMSASEVKLSGTFAGELKVPRDLLATVRASTPSPCNSATALT
ncbi:MAG: hypothetical protein ACNA7W_17125 [Pseudomonadales bacterium]